MEIKILSADYHRNGVGGNGFWAVIFDATALGVTRRMVASIFPHDRMNCAVFQIDKLAAGNVKFIENSWRGDVFSDHLADALPAFLGRSYAEMWEGK
jgi:hypothetical protein